MEMPTKKTQDNSTNQENGIDMAYVKNMKAWIRIAELVLSMIVFICVTVAPGFASYGGGGWVQFVSISAFIIGLILMIFHLYHITQRLPSPVSMIIVELGFAAVYAAFYFISGVVAAAQADKIWFQVTAEKNAMVACSVFSFIAMLVFGGDTALYYMAWRANNATVRTPPTTTTSQAPAISMPTPAIATPAMPTPAMPTPAMATPAPPTSSGPTAGAHYPVDMEGSIDLEKPEKSRVDLVKSEKSRVDMENIDNSTVDMDNLNNSTIDSEQWEESPPIYENVD